MGELEERTFYPGKTKWLSVFLGGFAFCAIGIFIMEPSDGWIRWFVIVFFGLTALIGAITLVPNSGYLKLDAYGFTTRSLFRDTTVSWADVTAFGIMTTKGGTYVTYERGESGMMAQVNRMVGDLSNALPDTYGMKAEELAEVMESYRQSAMQRAKKA